MVFLLTLLLITFTFSKIEYIHAETQKVSSKGFEWNDNIIQPKMASLDPEFRRLVLETSSNDHINSLIAHIKNRNQKVQNNTRLPHISNILLSGESGTGKTKLIQAIAEETNCDYSFINAPFLSEERSTSENLQKIFKNFINTDKFSLIIIKEVHCLNDKAFAFLTDLSMYNKNIMIVGITSEISRLPRTQQEAFSFFLYKPKSSAQYTDTDRQRILEYYLKQWPYDCNQKCKQSVAKQLKNESPSSIQNIVMKAAIDAYAGEKEWKITQDNLKKSINEHNETKKYFK